MTRFFPVFLGLGGWCRGLSTPAMVFAAVFCVFVASVEAAPSDSEAWKRALELAAAFTNDGFRIRDGHWLGRLESGSKVLEVNLYAGNAYWFCAATRNPQNVVQLSVHDALGAVLIPETTLDEGRSAVAFTPENSGPYYLRITVTPGPGQTPAPDSFCVVYSYK